MPKQFQATFNPDLTASTRVQSAIIAALTSEEVKKAKHLKCQHIIEMVKKVNGFDEENAINGLKVLANKEDVIIGRGLHRRSHHNGLKRRIKFGSRTIKLSQWLMTKSNEKLIYCGGEETDSSDSSKEMSV